jgi:hypothetical protein
MLLATVTIGVHFAVILVIAIGISATVTGRFFRMGKLFRTVYCTFVAVVVLSDLGTGFCPLTLAEKYFWNLCNHDAYQGSFFDRYFPFISDLVDGNAVKIMLSVTLVQLILWMVHERAIRKTNG